MPRVVVLASLVVLALLSCSGPSVPPGPPLPVRQAAAADALRALRESKFAEAGRFAEQVLQNDKHNPYAGLVGAIARYKATMHQLVSDLIGLAAGAVRGGSVNERFLQVALDGADGDLGRVDEHLHRAEVFPEFAVELCPACWEIDWNHDGRIDERDHRFLQLEIDDKGERLPEADPRRRPTFRFDHGDVLWARAFVAFQRAALNIAVAWRWSDVNDLLRQARSDKKPTRLVINIDKPARIAKARELLLEGLKLADQARQAYLAEADDDREWLPNPRQRSHPMPLPVDDALYQTWQLVVGDLQRLVRGEEGLSVAELAQLGDHKWEQPPGGYLDIGRMLDRPKAITIDLAEIEAFTHARRSEKEARPEALLRSVLGEYYRDAMKPSPLIGRLARMKSEINKGQESMERKLRYLLWLN